MKSVAIFCGSRLGSHSRYAAAAERLCEALVQHGIRVVYGGGSTGLMGTIADITLALGGKVVGVIPTQLVDVETAHRHLTELHQVDSMHERKQMMSDLSDGFIALPGGFGTLEEISEVLSWAQIGLHRKPIGFLDVEGYFDRLIEFFDDMVTHGFLRQESRDLVLLEENPRTLVDRMLGRISPG